MAANTAGNTGGARQSSHHSVCGHSLTGSPLAGGRLACSLSKEHTAALMGGGTISMGHQYPTGHITKAPGSLGGSVMCDNVLSTFNCGKVTATGQSQHRVMSAPRVTRNATLHPTLDSQGSLPRMGDI